MLTDIPLGIKVLYMCVKLSENSSRLRVIYRELNSGSLNITTAWQRKKQQRCCKESLLLRRRGYDYCLVIYNTECILQSWPMFKMIPNFSDFRPQVSQHCRLPNVFVRRSTQNTNRSSTLMKTKTSDAVVLQTFSTTFHFLRVFFDTCAFDTKSRVYGKFQNLSWVLGNLENNQIFWAMCTF